MKTFLFAFLLYHSVLHAHDHEPRMYPPWQGFEGLGEVDFATSATSAEAQRWFVLGIKLMYAYEWPSATYAFRQAQKLEPTFAMAYWGEAMTHFKLVWESYNPSAAQVVLARGSKAGANYELVSVRERHLLNALYEAISGDPKLAPSAPGSCSGKFRRRMERAEKEQPEDQVIKLWTAYAVLGTRDGIFDYAVNQAAGDRLVELLEVESQNIGVLHFIVHAYENSIQAPRARLAAERLAEVAPAAIHTLHMPSHYYFAQGAWQDVVRVNKHAWKQSQERRRDLELPTTTLEFHGLSWLPYAYLQLGDVQSAYNVLKMVADLWTGESDHSILVTWVYMRTTFLMESPSDNPLHQEVAALEIPSFAELPARARLGVWYQRAFAAYQKHAYEDFFEAFLAYQDVLTTWPADGGNMYAAALGMLNHLEALFLLGDEEPDRLGALQKLREQAAAEWQQPQGHGVPVMLQPTDELLAIILHASGLHTEAKMHAHRSLSYYKGRRRAVELAQ